MNEMGYVTDDGTLIIVLLLSGSSTAGLKKNTVVVVFSKYFKLFKVDLLFYHDLRSLRNFASYHLCSNLHANLRLRKQEQVYRNF